MPLGNLKVDTFVGDETIDGDKWNQEYYKRNNQTSEVKTGGVQPLTTAARSGAPTKPYVQPEKSYPKTDDEGLKKAIKKDQRKRNIN